MMAMLMLVWTAVAGAGLPPADEPLERVQFGSCLRQSAPQPIWDVVAAREPDLFLLIGDAVYARSFDPQVLRGALDELAAKPGFERVRSRTPVLAVWDDNDYGRSDSGAEHPRKDAAQGVFLEAFDEPADSPRWDREGLYGAWTLGPAGRRTQVIVLDTRYHRGPLTTRRLLGRAVYIPSVDRDVTMLGAAQWDWLERTLAEPAELRLIVSSIQVLPDNHPGEKWANLPHERDRLLGMLADADGAVVLLSGDQHLGELSQVHGRDGGRDLWELTASGMTHTRDIPAPNRHREGAIVLEHHVGEVAIDWAPGDPTVTLRIVTVDGEIALQKTLPLSELRSGGR